MPLEKTIFRPPNAGEAVVIAVFCYRYDAQLVPAFIENIKPIVHGYVAWDDRQGSSILTSEPDRRNALNSAAMEIGADWILAADPDERFEEALASRIQGMTIARHRKILWTFNQRELFTPDAWRWDGVWASKSNIRLYPADACRRPITQALHGSWVVDGAGFSRRHSGLNTYHLRHISAVRTQYRRDLYAAADPARIHQKIGYDYLTDARGCVLQTIPPERRYFPLHEDDGGLWGPAAISEVGTLSPDPVAKRLSYMTHALQCAGVDACGYAAQDLAQAGDADFRLLASGYALMAGRAQDALDLVHPLLLGQHPPILALVHAAKAMIVLGDRQGAMTQVSALQTHAPDSFWIAQTAAGVLSNDPPFQDTAARWRRWAGPNTQIYEGAKVGSGPMAVVVIGFRAQPGLVRAVRSVLDQSPDSEIIVVNTGGGDVRGPLAAVLPQIRLIEVPEPLFVGAARNIGIDASRAPFVAFLAGDCRAMPGWVNARMQAHLAGAASVSNPVIPDRPLTLRGIVGHALVYLGRDPSVNPDFASHYGRSYSRQLLMDAGYFPTGARVAEDSEFNRRCDRISRPVWVVGAQTVHCDPRSVVSLLKQAYDRSRRAANYLQPKRLLSQKTRAWAVKQGRERKMAADQWLARFEAAEPRALQAYLTAARALIAIGAQVMTLGYRHELRRLVHADSYMAKALGLLKSQPTQAAKYARRAVILCPQVPAHHIGLGRTYTKLRKPKLAVQCFEIALSINPTDARPLTLLCSILARQDNQTAAWKRAEEAVFMTPFNAAILLVAADRALQAGQPDLALAHTQRALMAEPENVAIQRLLADIHDALGQADKAAQRRAMATLIEEDQADRIARAKLQN